MSYVKIPNLPDNDVKAVIASCNISKKSEYTLNSYGIDVIKTKPHSKLYNAVKSHPDMLLYHKGDDAVICDIEAVDTVSELFSIENICSGNMLANTYPEDIAYNAARVGQFLICNKAHTGKNIIEDAESKGLEIINVKQGYAKCNISIISENAIITSDKGIKSALGKFPVDVLLIDDSSVLLKDFQSGFFGGATGKISYDKLAVNGNIKYHKCSTEIINFAIKHNVEIISLNNNYIEDIGSILPILVK